MGKKREQKEKPIDAAVAALFEAEQPSAVQAAFAALGLVTKSPLDAMVARSLLLAAIGDDTGAAKMWLVNRDPENWTLRTRRPKPKSGEATPAPIEENPFHGLRITG